VGGLTKHTIHTAGRELQSYIASVKEASKALLIVFVCHAGLRLDAAGSLWNRVQARLHQRAHTNVLATQHLRDLAAALVDRDDDR